MKLSKVYFSGLRLINDFNGADKFDLLTIFILFLSIYIIDLINDTIVEFYVFADKQGVLIQDEIITTLPAYILIKLKHDIGIDVHLPGLPPLVIDIEPSSTTYYGDDGKIAMILQFPVILGYIITDFKCQSRIFSNVIVDIK